MHVESVFLSDYGPFKGEHEVRLDEKAYSLVARRDDAPDRSNWQGKSTFLNAVRHALTGQHTWTTEDEWITRGQPMGLLRVEFVNDEGELVSVQRSRPRGRATKLVVSVAARCGAEGPKAEELLTQLVGLGRDDFDATCWFGQKRMDRFVVASPAERMEVVRGWLQLGRLEACAGKATVQLHAATSRAASAQQRVDNARANRRSWLSDAGVDPDAADPTRALAERDAALATAEELLAGRAATLEDMKDRWHQQAASAEKGAEYARLVERGRALKATVADLEVCNPASNLDQVREAHAEARSRVKDARTRLEQYKGLVTDGFDGECPVAGRPCPQRGWVDEQLDAFEGKATSARVALAEYEDELAIRAGAEKECAGDATALTLGKEQLEDLRERARALRPHEHAKHPAPLEAVAEQLAEIRSSAAEVKAKRMAVLRAQQKLSALAKEEEVAAAEHRDADAAAGAWRATTAVMRRAQRHIAEGALAAMRAGANAVFAGCGIDLALEVSWGREGKGPADACDACGRPLPASAKVRACPSCGEARGPKVVQRLDVLPTSTSGGALDLAGVAFQLAASAWLRRQRGCAWGTALIDEPFGALDAANRRALANHLAAMLPRYGFRQSIVVSHTQETAHALPGRIVVIGGADGSRLEVEA